VGDWELDADAGAGPLGLPAVGIAPVTELPVIVCPGGREDTAPTSRNAMLPAAPVSASTVTVRLRLRLAPLPASRPCGKPGEPDERGEWGELDE